MECYGGEVLGDKQWENKEEKIREEISGGQAEKRGVERRS